MTITEKWEKKANKIMEKGFDLTRSEVNKIYAAAKRRNPGKLPEVESWFCGFKADEAFQTVECHIYDGLTDERLDDIVIHCCMFDRRRSFIL